MADSTEELREEFEEYEQSESAMFSGSESAPSGALRPWIKWMILVDVIVIAVVLAIVFAN
ncbi:MAG: hypothetical protein J0H98_05065 [Solirubrobacterales bacterium]|nr:hypothetical protein [Solirubrobacterales bacterium]